MNFATILRDPVAELEAERSALAAELDQLTFSDRPAARIEARANAIARRGETINGEIDTKRERAAELPRHPTRRNPR